MPSSTMLGLCWVEWSKLVMSAEFVCVGGDAQLFLVSSTSDVGEMTVW
jgi:hypothetical protein